MKLNYYIIAWSMLFAASCETAIETPDFRVTSTANEYKAGEEIRFMVEGNADMVSFYSGEPNNEYAFKDGRVIDVSDEGVTMEFSSGVTGGTQEDQLSVLASTDFNGDYDNLAKLKAATWVDITERFTLGTSSSFVPSTSPDISDLLEPGKPIYIAFKYINRPQAVNGMSNNWMIQGFEINSQKLYNDAPLTITDLVHAGFQIVDQEPENAPSRSVITATRISLLGNIYKDPNDPLYDPENPIYDPENPIYDPESHLYQPNSKIPEFIPYDPSSPYNDPETENWAVSKGIMIDSVDLGPDWSKAIKGISNSKMEEFRYTYSQPGTYKAYFVAINANIDGRKEIIKEMEITIVP